MRQIVQKLKTGLMQIIEVPVPSLQKGCIFVKTHYSLISAGTESSTVKTARKSIIGKAKERPQQLKQVVDVLKSQGPVQTYRAVMKKLDSYSPLGYSCAGQILDIGPEVHGFSVGDFVACGGLTASHAEIVSVPANLCVKLEPNADLKQAAYNTLGAIALQGVRQANVRLGETCAVLGLGLLGQLTALLLKASGVRTVGIDIDPAMVDKGEKHCLNLAVNRKEDGVEGRIFEFTRGIGCDAVIITAASDSLDPINFAGAISRKKGSVVVVGAVPTGFEREPHFYKKELQIKMSCSYGPGRYDPSYEDKGHDYPVAYVRWTENRNMQAFQDLLHHGKIDVTYLTTHTIKLDDAPTTYDMILSKSEPFIGILIEYDATKEHLLSKTKIPITPQVTRITPRAVNIGFIGAGSYAQNHLLPNIPKKKGVNLVGVLTASSTGTRSAAERFIFSFCTTKEEDIIQHGDINTIFIATRHDSHAEFVIKALNTGKNVFVEKPLCLKEEELGQIVELMSGQKLDNSSNSDTNKPFIQSTNQPILMVGYNRRFSPLTKKAKELFQDDPVAMIYRVNCGNIPADSWIQDLEVGGGRIIGEVCHFVDYLTYMNGSLPSSVYATAMQDHLALDDIVNISLKFENGSIGTIAYFANGDKSLPKERIEIYANQCTAVIDDFRILSIFSRGKKKDKKLLSQDKGQHNQVKQYVDAILHGKDPLIPFEQLYSASHVTFKIIESIRSGKSIRI